MPRKFYKCAVRGCSSTEKYVKGQSALHFRRCAPAEIDPLPLCFHTIKTEWLEKIGRLDLLGDKTKLKRSQICSKHFKDRAYSSTLRQRLCRGAEPELFLPNPNGESGGEPKIVHIPSGVPERWQATRFALRSGLNHLAPQPQGTNNLPVGDPNMTEDDLARFAVSTLYSSSEGEGEEENDSTNYCGIAESESKAALGSLRSAESPPLPAALTSPRTRSQANGTTSKPSPAKRKERQIRAQKSSSGGCNHGPYIKKLEKCLVERSVEIKGLKAEILRLKRKNEKLTQLRTSEAEENMKLSDLIDLTDNV